MNPLKFHFMAAVMAALVLLSQAACNRNVLSGSKLTLANYNQITTGMSKGQAQQILGAPTTTESKNMVLFQKTTYRWEDGQKFVLLTFKNDELESKDTNLGTQ